MTKVYQLRRRFAAVFETSYCGVPVQLVFSASIGNAGENRAELATSDRFTQDAIEHDPRFGKEFFLVESYGSVEAEPDPELTIEEAEEEAEPAPAPAPKKVATKKKSKKVKVEEPSEQPEGKVFANLNDAVYHLEEELGIDTEGKDIDALLKENKIIVKG